MQFQLGKQYDVSLLVQNEPELVGTPDIVTCHDVDEDGDMWSYDVVWLEDDRPDALQFIALVEDLNDGIVVEMPQYNLDM